MGIARCLVQATTTCARTLVPLALMICAMMVVLAPCIQLAHLPQIAKIVGIAGWKLMKLLILFVITPAICLMMVFATMVAQALGTSTVNSEQIAKIAAHGAYSELHVIR